MILAVDPGDTTGISGWDENYKHLFMEQVKYEDFPRVLNEKEALYGKVTLFVVEDYVLFGKRAIQQTGSKMLAARGIGQVQMAAADRGAEVVIQPSSIKSVALKWSGIKMPSNHKDTHEYDAFLHGFHWLVKEGKIKTPLQRRKEKENG